MESDKFRLEFFQLFGASFDFGFERCNSFAFLQGGGRVEVSPARISILTAIAARIWSKASAKPSGTGGSKENNCSWLSLILLDFVAVVVAADGAVINSFAPTPLG